jgi:hypothetical protein
MIATTEISNSTAFAVLVPHPGTIRTAIASLHNRDMALMPRDDLIDLIRLSRMTTHDFEQPAEIDQLADNELARLAFLVRRCCRNQLDAHRQQSGQPLLWAEAI